MPTQTRRLSLHLECIQGVAEKSQGVTEFFKSAKATIDLGGPNAKCYLILSFPKGGRDQLLKTLRQAISQRGWEKGPEASEILNIGQYKPKVNAGIGTLIAMQDNQTAATGALLGDALSDLDALMLQAKDMVALAEKFKAAAADDAAAVGGGVSRSGGAAQTGAVALSLSGGADEELLVQAGIMSPVSLKVAGKSFHSELARQLAGTQFTCFTSTKVQILTLKAADFLTPILIGGGGGGGSGGEGGGGGSRSEGRARKGLSSRMITLTDAYCLYNRARGIDLVAPADLRQA
jgi:hypothetical protein